MCVMWQIAQNNCDLHLKLPHNGKVVAETCVAKILQLQVSFLLGSIIELHSP